MPLIDPGITNIIDQHRPEFAIERNFVGSTSGDWQSSEDVVGAYAMGGYTLNELELFTGVRFEHTSFESNGLQVDENTETVVPLSERKSYDEWLPGIHARYTMSDELVFRAAYTQTIARPGFEQSAAAAVIDGDEITRGNPGLNRVLSTNYDICAEFYLPETLGLVSVAAFYKDIEGFLFTRVVLEDIGGETFEVTSFDNGSAGDIYGLEFAYQQQLSFLPPPLDGLSFYGNVVWGDSHAMLPRTINRNDVADLRIPFPRQSDIVGNVALTFEKGARVLARRGDLSQ
jgi:TonB-dependent receptor